MGLSVSLAEPPEPAASWLRPSRCPVQRDTTRLAGKCKMGVLLGLRTWDLLLPSPVWWFLMQVSHRLSLRTTATTTDTSGAMEAPGSSSAPAREYGTEMCRAGGLVGLTKRGMDPAAPFLPAGIPSGGTLELHRWSCKPSSRCFVGLVFHCSPSPILQPTPGVGRVGRSRFSGSTSCLQGNSSLEEARSRTPQLVPQN